MVLHFMFYKNSKLIWNMKAAPADRRDARLLPVGQQLRNHVLLLMFYGENFYSTSKKFCSKTHEGAWSFPWRRLYMKYSLFLSLTILGFTPSWTLMVSLRRMEGGLSLPPPESDHWWRRPSSSSPNGFLTYLPACEHLGTCSASRYSFLDEILWFLLKVMWDSFRRRNKFHSLLCSRWISSDTTTHTWIMTFCSNFSCFSFPLGPRLYCSRSSCKNILYLFWDVISGRRQKNWPHHEEIKGLIDLRKKNRFRCFSDLLYLEVTC